MEEKEWDEYEEKVSRPRLEPSLAEIADEHYREEQRIAYQKFIS